MTKTGSEFPLFTSAELARLGIVQSELLLALENDLGVEAVWKLTTAFGGVSVHIPRHGEVTYSQLAKGTNPSIAKWLQKNIGWGSIIVPNGPNTRRARNLAYVRSPHAINQGSKGIALHLGCHMRTVERYRAELRRAGLLSTQKRENP